MTWWEWVIWMVAPIALIVYTVLWRSYRLPAKGRHAREAECTSRVNGSGDGITAGQRQTTVQMHKHEGPPATPVTQSRPPADAADRWARVNPSRERLATTGELRILAETGALAEIQSDNAAFSALRQLEEWTGNRPDNARAEGLGLARTEEVHPA